MSAKVTRKTHDNNVCEVWYTSSASIHQSRLETSFARDFETQRFMLHQLIFLEGFHKVEHIACNFNFSFLFQPQLFFGVLDTVPHLFKLFHRSPEVTDLQLLISSRSKGIFDIWVSAGVFKLHRQREVLSVCVHFHFFQKLRNFLMLFLIFSLSFLLAMTQVLIGPSEKRLNVGHLSSFRGQL